MLARTCRSVIFTRPAVTSIGSSLSSVPRGQLKLLPPLGIATVSLCPALSVIVTFAAPPPGTRSGAASDRPPPLSLPSTQRAKGRNLSRCRRADRLGQLDDDPRRAAEVAEPEHVLVAHDLADEL